VKALANQTAKATEEISAQIFAIQQATKASAGLIHDITETIGEVSETAAAIAASVQEQGTATQEIARNVLTAGEATRQVSDAIAGIGEAARMTGAAAIQMNDAAGGLTKDGETLKRQWATFLREVRAA
jgi:methyl-accepting chemotaxis protein